MYRLFVAVDLPEPVKDRLVALRADIPGATWVKPNAMHLTLRFLGDGIAEAQLAAIQAALAGVRAAAFDLTVRGVGRFPPGSGPARVVWAGMDRQPALQALHAQVESALSGAGFAPEGRTFDAHITLARIKQPRASADVQRFLTAHADFAVAPFAVEQFILYASQLTSSGPVYTRQGVYGLG